MSNIGPLENVKFEPLSRDSINSIIFKLPIPYKVIFEIQYLTAARISEVLLLNKNNFEVRELGREKILTIDMKILKRRNRLIRKTVPINLNDIFVKDIIDYVHSSDEDILFKNTKGQQITKNLAWKYLQEVSKDLRTHTFRHSRITELFKEMKWSEKQVQQFVGWKDLGPASTYIHLKWEDMAKKVLEETKK